jgi:hypothetical protein
MVRKIDERESGISGKTVSWVTSSSFEIYILHSHFNQPLSLPTMAIMNNKHVPLLLLASCLLGAALPTASAFLPSVTRPAATSSLQAKLSELPKGISPFEKADARSLNLEADFRSKATGALQQARKDGKRQLEIEFPPLLFKGKTQFDDFDNVQELDLNRDWCIEWLPGMNAGTVWFALPDLKECELAKEEWRGGMYRDAAKFSTIEEITRHYTNDEEYSKPWGASLANGVSNLFAGGELLGDTGALDTLEGSPDLHLIW